MTHPKVRSGVRVVSRTPALYREFLRLVSLTRCAKRDGETFHVTDRAKWSDVLEACETVECQ